MQALPLVSTSIRKSCTCVLFFKAIAEEAQLVEEEYRSSDVSREDFQNLADDKEARRRQRGAKETTAFKWKTRLRVD